MENNFTFIASKALDDPEVTKGTLLWHLYSGEKTPIASISHRSIYGGNYCSATVEYNGGSLSCSAWCDHITGKGALPFTDSSGNTVAVLRHKYTLATNERWTMEYDGDIYPITVTQDSVSHKKQFWFMTLSRSRRARCCASIPWHTLSTLKLAAIIPAW